ncbi:uncharacterized protein LOC111619105 isoform X2 [Centruroides sculpturatus]|uniref:uncharacterized protein LOC111619105 isoform X2 n=1 Tax=Centruroides sculpturatus TaxID=218467 RepID=UPI000C6DAB03|nr:uncharacterized protein LOC111619105 isoform X2 [Centruroides sculpturatus]
MEMKQIAKFWLLVIVIIGSSYFVEANWFCDGYKEKSCRTPRCGSLDCDACFKKVWWQIKELSITTWQNCQVMSTCVQSYVQQQMEWICPLVKVYAQKSWYVLRVCLYRFLCYLEKLISEWIRYLEKDLDCETRRTERSHFNIERIKPFLIYLLLLLPLILFYFIKLTIYNVIDNYATFYIPRNLVSAPEIQLSDEEEDDNDQDEQEFNEEN